MRNNLPIEERASLLERELELTTMMVSMLLAYLESEGVLSLADFENWQRGRLALLDDPIADSVFRRQRLGEMIAEARAIRAIAAS